MKRVLSTILAATFLSTALLAGTASADEAPKSFAFGSDKQAVEEQGANGWYYLYSEEYNKGAGFDVDKFKECVWGANTAYAAWGGEYWCPADYPEEFAEAGNNWFLIDATGRVEGAGNRTAAVKWVAPYDGAFTIKATVDAGVSDQFFQYMEEYEGMEWQETYDGVDCLIVYDYDLLAENNTGVEWGWYETDGTWWEGYGQIDGSDEANWEKIKHQSTEMGEWTLSMKAGEALYFITDNKVSSDYDYAQWDIEIDCVGEAVYSFGGGGSVPTTQGVDGWYYLFSRDINQGDNFDLASFEECAYPGATSGIMAWGGDYWTPDMDDSELSDFISEDDPETPDVDEWKNEFWWSLDPVSGAVVPDGNLTAAVKWVVPVSGKYDMTVLLSGGYSTSYEQWGLPEEVPNDGVYASVYYNGERIFSKDCTGKPAEVTALDKEMELTAGDEFYFIMDPKELAGRGYDAGTYKVTALLIEADAQQPAPSEPTEPAEPTEPTGSADPTNPNTGEAGIAPAALALMGVAAGAVLLCKKKKA